ncbi:hypothetical protein EUX98_g412 [Antrodiella citrinella]|uniref:DUF4187 domain-containing protein n=1 Tax=Antrodiella citrinella TaxID=2447956 RepID=A0A4S4N429_9APHY|nr:hypothetical protein EUX98_g412 [Antrodiella citrinella]
MSNDEDDYLSDKFLLVEPSASNAPKTYSQQRRERERLAALRNEQNRRKSRKELEQESREAGLTKSLFERAEEDAGGKKALAMMMKMGFKPGQSLGQSGSQPAVPNDEPIPTSGDVSGEGSRSESPERSSSSKPAEKLRSTTGHLVAPLPLNEWTGRTGIGLRKRAASPSASERMAKMAKMAEAHDHSSFRDRARQEYQDRQAEGRLGPAQRTCASLDEKAGRKFNVLSLNPENPDTFPEGLIDVLGGEVLSTRLDQLRSHGSIEGRLRAKMQADALQPLKPSSELDDDDDSEALRPHGSKVPYSEEDLEECTAFLRLSAKDRLSLVLDYLRDRYQYCFWCGTQYDDVEDLAANCPGPEEDAHD